MSESTGPGNNKWVLLAFISTFLLCISNANLTVITQDVKGFETWFYLGSGGVFGAFCFNVWKYARDEKFMPQNLIVDGELKLKNIGLFLIMSILYFGS